MGKVRKGLVNLGLLILASLAALIIAEFIVRVLYKDTLVLFPRYHTDARYGQFTLRTIRPNSQFWHTSPDGSWRFTTNKQGFRSHKDFEYKKPDGTLRVLSLGDSHTQGYEVDDHCTFSAIIETYLQRRGRNVEVMNAGVSGFSTAEELALLENGGIKYAPDFVVLGFFANDFQDNINAGLFRLGEDGNLVIQKKEHIPGVRIQNIIYELPLVKWLSENSYSYCLMFNTVWRYFKARQAKTVPDQVLEYAIPTQETFSDYQVALASAIIGRMNDFCQKNGIRLIIVDIPQISRLNEIESSFPASLLETMPDYCDAFVSSDSLLGDYSGVVDLHRPHGHRHITKFAHALIGVAVAKRIELLIQ